MSYALVFPGQGAQEVGMSRDFYDEYPVCKEVFDRADEALGFSLSKIIFEGPEDELKKTAITQPSILTASIAVLEAARHAAGGIPAPGFAAGHSLGEYTALVAAGSLTLEDGVRLVHLRGDLMQKAVPIGEGAMAAILGLSEDAILEVCKEAAKIGVCETANFNAPSQIVISGQTKAIEAASGLAKERGAMKVIPLKVSAPFHCALMRPVADGLREAFAKISWKDPSWWVVANFDAKPIKTAPEAQEALYSQTYSPVRWVESVKAMSEGGVDMFIEMGPGNVLSGLNKRIVKGTRTINVTKTSDLPPLVQHLKGLIKCMEEQF